MLQKSPQVQPLQTQSGVGLWLILVAVMIFAMVIVGGATRLTNSGLSITEWQPLLGAIPPLNDADWQTAFAKYQQSSQYRLQNTGMAMPDFQFIYWWEWSHRFLGRIIGFVFFVPFVYFLFTRRIGKKLWPRLGLIFLGGAAQGALGWYMVASGLVDRVDVSQYRLAAHLTLATLLLAAVVWTVFSLKTSHHRPNTGDQFTALAIWVLVLIQVAAGGFVAGLDAGQGYNTWPLMDGAFFPRGLDVMQPVWRNLFENALTVQFDHRILAYTIFAIALVHAWRSRVISSWALAAAVTAQACLGIVTLLLHVPLHAALAHQAGAMIVMVTALWNLHRMTMASPSLG